MSVRSAVAAPAVAYASAQAADVDAYTLTAARFWATSAALLGLAGVVIGKRALTRAARRFGDGGRRGAIMALVSGLIAMVGGALDLAVADGGPGTGNGVVGGALALVLGLTAAQASTRSGPPARHRPAGCHPGGRPIPSSAPWPRATLQQRLRARVQRSPWRMRRQPEGRWVSWRARRRWIGR
jgi:uncharacterized protein DUF6223